MNDMTSLCRIRYVSAGERSYQKYKYDYIFKRFFNYTTPLSRNADKKFKLWNSLGKETLFENLLNA